MSQSVEQCTDPCRKPRLSLRERASVVTIVNVRKRRLHKIRVDGCLFEASDPEKRCDFLINVADLSRSIIVELKGSDLDAALEQLAESHRLLDEFRHSKVTWIVSCQSTPKTTTKTQNELVRKRKAGITIVIRDSPLHFNLETNKSV